MRSPKKRRKLPLILFGLLAVVGLGAIGRAKSNREAARLVTLAKEPTRGTAEGRKGNASH